MALSMPVPELPQDAPAALRTYFHMWNERDPDRIRDHLDASVSHDCVWVDPLHSHVGRDALEANVRGFREMFPNADLGVASKLDAHNDRIRYHWIILNDGDVLIHGFDVATLNTAGLIERVDGFFGLLDRIEPPETN